MSNTITEREVGEFLHMYVDRYLKKHQPKNLRSLNRIRDKAVKKGRALLIRIRGADLRVIKDNEIFGLDEPKPWKELREE